MTSLGYKRFCFSCVDIDTRTTESKKLRRRLQRKRRNKMELCVKLSVLWLLPIGHVVQNKRSALLLAWHE